MKKMIVLAVGLLFAVVTGLKASDLMVSKADYNYTGDDATGWYFDATNQPTVNVVAWGKSSQCTNIPPDATNVVQVSAGWDNVVALTADNRVIVWGTNVWSHAGLEPTFDRAVLKVLAGRHYDAAVLDDGSVKVWGQFGTSVDIEQTIPLSDPAVDISFVETNEIFALLQSGDTMNIVESGGSITTTTNGQSGVTAIASAPGRHMTLAGGTTNATVKTWGGTATNVSAWAVSTNTFLIAQGTVNDALVQPTGNLLYWSPTLTANGTMKTGGHIGLGAYGTSIYGLKSDGTQIRYLGSLSTAPVGTPPLSAIAVGNIVVVGIKQ